LTDEAAGRTDLVKAQLKRTEARATFVDETDFLKALEVSATIDRITDPAYLSRIVELFQRTTQFNTTGKRYAEAELMQIATTGGGVYAMRVSDRYGDHGLCGAAVVEDGVITGFAMSCRVIGLKVEQQLVARMLTDAAPGVLRAQIIPTERNAPARNLFSDAGFAELGDGWWTSAK
jgi:FkbH-like protein